VSGFYDDFSGYAVGGVPQGTWVGNLPTVATVGRNGAKAIAKGPLQWLRSDRQARTPFAQGVIVLRVDDAGGYVSVINAKVGNGVDTVTMRHMLIGFGINNVCHVGVCASADGALHLVRGSAFDYDLNNRRWSWEPDCPMSRLLPCPAVYLDSPTTALVASSPPGTIPIGRGWFVLELVAGSPTRVYVNGQLVIDHPFLVRSVVAYPAYTKCCQEKLIEFPPDSGFYVPRGPTYVSNLVLQSIEWVGVGGGSVGTERAGAVNGWSGRIAGVGIFAAEETGNSSIGDLQVETLLASAESGAPISSITGTTPAPSRVASIDDFGTPDDAATTVTFTDTDAPGVDAYNTSGLSIAGDANVYAVQVASRARASTPGYVVPRFGVTVGAGTGDESGATFRGSQFRYAARGLARPGGGEWTPADLTAMDLRIGRTE
jgi:hypothetical protein